MKQLKFAVFALKAYEFLESHNLKKLVFLTFWT